MASSLEGGSRDQRSLQQSNHDMLDQQVATDVTFRVSSPDGSTAARDVGAHRCILMTRCEYFHAMFTSGMEETHGDVINIDDIEPETFQIVLRYVYSQHTADITPENLPCVLNAARKYQLVGLVEQCADIAASSLTIDNVCKVLEESERYELPRLESDCLSFIGRNMRSFVETDSFRQLSARTLDMILKLDRLELADEGEVYATCVKWAKWQLQQSMQLDDPTDQQIRRQLGDVIYRVRIPTAIHSQFAAFAAGTDLLTSDEKIAISVYIGSKERTGDMLFDASRRQYLMHVRSRFKDAPVESLYVSDGHATDLCFSVSVDAALFAVGLYGGRTQGHHEHRIDVTILNDAATPISTTSTRMLSTGSNVPVKVPLDQVAELKAELKYTIVVRIFGAVNTHAGVDSLREVRLECDDVVTVTFHWSGLSGSLSSFKNGQIPELYFFV